MFVCENITDFITSKTVDDVVDSINVEPFALAEGGKSGLKEPAGKPDGCFHPIMHDSTSLYLDIP